jgi:hypothetical protein
LEGLLFDQGSHNIASVRQSEQILPLLADKLDPAYHGFVMRVKKMLEPKGIMNPDVIVSG